MKYKNSNFYFTATLPKNGGSACFPLRRPPPFFICALNISIYRFINDADRKSRLMTWVFVQAQIVMFVVTLLFYVATLQSLSFAVSFVAI